MSGGLDGACGPLSARCRVLWADAQRLTCDRDPVERLLLVTASYRASHGQPMVLRRALAFRAELAAHHVAFEDRVLYAGQPFRRVGCHTGVDLAGQEAMHYLYPEGHGLHGNAIHLGPDAARAFAYWQSQPLPPLWKLLWDSLDADTQALQQVGVCQHGGWVSGHQAPGLEGALREGLAARLARVEVRQQAADSTAEQRTFLQAAAIVLRAALDYAERLAAAARAEAVGADAQRAADLHEVAAILDHVPAHPPRTMREAVQAVWLLHLLTIVEQPGSFANSLGRLDQVLGPYYEADLAAGRVTPTAAQELIDALWCKLYRLYDDQNTVVGGLTPAGDDAVNAVSWMILEATERVPYHRDVTVRVHAGTPQPFVRRAVELLRLGLGRPDFQNDEVVIPGLVARGIPVEVARDYVPVGCVEIQLPGVSCVRTMASATNLLKILELTLHGGRCLLTGRQVCADVPATFASYEALHAEYRRLAAHCQDLTVGASLQAEALQAARLPHPYLSVLNEGPLETARDITDGGCRWNLLGVNLIGIADLANALYALRALVFEQQTVTLDTFRAALAADWVGHEALRQTVRALPKFGQDHVAVDTIAAEEAGWWGRRLAGFTTRYPGFVFALLFGTTSNCVFGLPRQTAASPDGRRCGDPLSQSAQPAVGSDTAGPTALLNSVARLPGRDLCGGVSFVPDLDPVVLAGDRGADATVALLRGYFAQGGAELGPQVLSAEQLRAAQQDPSGHRHVFVRLFGYSARFTTLAPPLQEYVISKATRTTPGG